MRPLKILHCADVHLDAPFRFLGPRGEDQRTQIRNTFEKVCQKASDDGFDLLLIAGDLFDSNSVSDRTVEWVTNCLKNIGLPVCICPGNHDCLDQTSVYRRPGVTWPDTTTIFSDPLLTSHALPDLDLVVHAAPIRSARTSASPLDGLTRRDDARWNVAMAHGSIVIPGKVEDTDAPIRRQDIEASGFDYVALGHWHTWADYTTDRVKAVYPGSPECMDFCGGPGSVACVTLADSGVSVQRVEVGVRTMSKMGVTLTGVAEAGEVSREIALAADRDLALRVTIEGLSDVGFQIDVSAMQGELADRFFFLQIDDLSHPCISSVSEDLFPENLVIGRYVRSMKQQIEAAAGDDESIGILEDALRLGVALLQGRQAL